MAMELIPTGIQLTFLPPLQPFYQISEETKGRILRSFECFFREKIVPLIPSDLVAELYCSANNVRPAKSAVNTVAAILYMRTLNIDEEFFLNHIHTDVAMQYAIVTEDYMSQPYSDRTFSRFRERLFDYEDETSVDIWGAITDRINLSIADAMRLNHRFNSIYSSAYRIDSLMIDAHAAHMTRLQLLYGTTQIAVLVMVQLGIVEYISKSLVHYLDPKDDHKRTYYKGTLKELKQAYEDLGIPMPQDDSSSDTDNRKKRLGLIGDLRLRQIVGDIIVAKKMLEEHGLAETEEYCLVQRVIDDQIDFDENGNASPREGKLVSGSSLQSIYDDYMSYRKKNDEKNYGYVGCTAEKYDSNGHGCIVWRRFEPNVYSDQKFADEFYDHLIQVHSLNEENSNRIAVSCDALFTSAELQNKVKDKRIDIYCASTGYTPDPILTEFKLSDDMHSIEECPMGNVPECTFDPDKSGGIITARFKEAECASCKYESNCKASTGKRKISKVEVKLNQVLAAQNIKKMNDPVFHMFVDKRNGVESIPGAFRKRYRIDDCPYFGFRYQRMHFFTSTSALNIKKYYLYCLEMGLFPF